MISVYYDNELKKFAQLFKKWEHDGHNIWAFFNNVFYGYSIENALTLIEMMEKV